MTVVILARQVRCQKSLSFFLMGMIHADGLSSSLCSRKFAVQDMKVKRPRKQLYLQISGNHQIRELGPEFNVLSGS
jgi:hypothetical protein